MYYGYARVSTEEQNDTSIEVQLSYLEQQAKNLGESFTPKFEKQSGKNVDDRAVFKSLLSTLKKGDILGVYDNSRLSRAVVDSLKVIDELAAKGVRIHCEGQFIDPKDPTQRVMFVVQSGFSEYQRGIQLKKSLAGIERKKQNGDWVLRGDLFGWKTYKTRGKTFAEVDPTAAKYIKYIFEQYASGKSTNAIAFELEDVIVPGWEKFRFTACNVNRMLQKPIYMGYYTLQTQDWYRIRRLSKAQLKAMLVKSNVYEPIISEELYWQVFDSWRTVKRSHAQQYEYRWSAYELSSIFRCPSCGVGWTHNYYKSSISEATYEHYVNLSHKKTCKPKLYRGYHKGFLENVVRACMILTFKYGNEVGKFFEDEQAKIGVTKDELNAQLEEIEKLYKESTSKISNLVEAVADGLFDKNVVKDKMADLKEQQDKLLKQKKNVEDALAYQDDLFEDLLEQASQDVIDDYIHASDTWRRDKLKMLLNKAYVYDDHFEIEFINGKHFEIATPIKKQRIPPDVKFKMSFRGQEQETGIISFRRKEIKFDYVKCDKETREWVNNWLTKLAKEVSDKLKEFDTVQRG